MFRGRGITQITYHAEGVINNEAAAGSAGNQQNCNLIFFGYASGKGKCRRDETEKDDGELPIPSVRKFYPKRKKNASRPDGSSSNF